MSKGANLNNQLRDTEPTGLEDDQIANAQEAKPIPYLAGTRRVALVWLSRVYNQYAKEVPAARSGKK